MILSKNLFKNPVKTSSRALSNLQSLYRKICGQTLARVPDQLAQIFRGGCATPS
jgi:hypothetical protein